MIKDFRILYTCERNKEVDKTAMFNEIFNSLRISGDLAEAICTDGALSMLMKYSGFEISSKQRNANVISSHFILHQHALSLETRSSYFQGTLDVAVQAVSLVQGRALSHSMFYMLFKEV